MRITIHSRRPSVSEEDTIAWLDASDWDDWFEFETSFNVYIHDNNEWTQIGAVKIGMQKIPGTIVGKTKVREFIKLDSNGWLNDNFFSVGQSIDYYRLVNEVLGERKSEYYQAMNDIAFNRALFNQVKELSIT